MSHSRHLRKIMSKLQLTKMFALSAMAGMASLTGMAAESNAAASATDAVVASAATDETQNWYNFGWLVSQSIVALDMNEQERAEFIKGIEGGLTGKEGPGEDMLAQQKLNQFLEARFIKATTAKNTAFFAELEKNPNVKKTDSGLYYEIINPGNDARATQSDSVRVHYRGALTDGTVFDSSFERGEPATFPVNAVVPGFGEGVTLVGEGGEVKLYIPSNLAYGETPPMGSGIPPNSPLVFEVKVEQVAPAAAAPQ